MTFPSLLLAALLAAAPEPAPRPFAMRALIPLTVGSVLLIGGGIFLGLSVAQTNDAARLEPEPREALLYAATSNRVGGVMLLVSGVLVASIAAFLFWFVPEPRVTIGLTPISDAWRCESLVRRTGSRTTERGATRGCDANPRRRDGS